MTSTQLSRSVPYPPTSRSSRINVGPHERLASLAGGTLLALVTSKSRCGLPMRLGLLAASGALLQRGLSGHCWLNEKLGHDTADGEPEPLSIRTVLTVGRPREEVYAAWRRFEDFPLFMQHLSEVRTNGKTSHWVAPLPGGYGKLEWDAEITADENGERIAWASVPGALVDNAGEVRFMDAPGQRGTELHARIAYRMPAGDVGRLAARLLDPAFETMVENDLRRFKQFVETGEVATNAGQPKRGRR